MPEYLAPGVYVEEISFRSKSIAGVSTGVTALVGYARRGPLATAKTSREITSFAEFEQRFGGLADLSFPPKTNSLARAAKAFFDEGGRRLVVARVRSPGRGRPTTIEDWQRALDGLAGLKNISIVAAPGSTEFGSLSDSIQSRLIAHVETPGRHRFAVLDVPLGKSVVDATSYRSRFDSKCAAFYYPWVTVGVGPATRGATNTLYLPPSGFISGIYARTDLERGVFTAPANEVVRSAVGFEQALTNGQQEILNPAGVNVLRFFE
jgi:phage tail sheath protein FI